MLAATLCLVLAQAADAPYVDHEPPRRLSKVTAEHELERIRAQWPSPVPPALIMAAGGAIALGSIAVGLTLEFSQCRYFLLSARTCRPGAVLMGTELTYGLIGAGLMVVAAGAVYLLKVIGIRLDDRLRVLALQANIDPEN